MLIGQAVHTSKWNIIRSGLILLCKFVKTVHVVSQIQKAARENLNRRQLQGCYIFMFNNVNNIRRVHTA